MRLGTPSATTGQIRSRTSGATQCGVTTSTTSDAAFCNAIVDISRATSCGVIKYYSRHEVWRDQKGYFLQF
jgi:hypothetical protein